MVAKIALYSLVSGLVLDRSVFVTQTAAEINEAVASIRAIERNVPLVVVDRASVFFTAANMLSLIKSGDESYKLVAEQAGITVSESDVVAIRRAEELQLEMVSKMRIPTPPYPFADVPEGWNVENNIEFYTTGGRDYVRRNDDHRYQLTVKQAEKIWARCATIWFKNSSSQLNKTIEGFSAQGYSYGRVQPNLVHIGCQSIYRHELEQLALHLNWDFPANETA
jgi:hypothetical protein